MKPGQNFRRGEATGGEGSGQQPQTVSSSGGVNRFFSLRLGMKKVTSQALLFLGMHTFVHSTNGCQLSDKYFLKLQLSISMLFCGENRLMTRQIKMS